MAAESLVVYLNTGPISKVCKFNILFFNKNKIKSSSVVTSLQT